MTGVNYAKYGCSSSRTSPGVTLYKSNTAGKTLMQLLLKIGWWMKPWKDKLKTELEFFNILEIGQKYLRFYRTSFFNVHRVINFCR